MIIELFDIGTEVYYLSPKGVESGVIDYYVISKDIICAYDKDGCLLSDIQDLHNNYEDAYEEWEDKFGNEKNKGRW